MQRSDQAEIISYGKKEKYIRRVKRLGTINSLIIVPFYNHILSEETVGFLLLIFSKYLIAYEFFFFREKYKGKKRKKSSIGKANVSINSYRLNITFK